MGDDYSQGSLLRGQFRILSVIGRGATSKVYLAKDLRGGHLCAVKVMPMAAQIGREVNEQAAMVMSEARLLTSLSHPGLPTVYDFFLEANTYFLIMEWIAGQTLYQIMLDRAAPVSEAEVTGWGIEICRILEYLHTRRPQPVVVGDIKPNNVMRTFEGQLKLIDFGIARYADAGVKSTEHAYVSPGFSPPEQYRRRALDHRSDIYSLGATLYFLVTGESLERHRFQIPDLRSVAPACTRQLEKVLERCLQYDRENRYQKVGDVRADLMGAQEVERRRDNVNAQARDILASLYRSKKNRRDP